MRPPRASTTRSQPRGRRSGAAGAARSRPSRAASLLAWPRPSRSASAPAGRRAVADRSARRCRSRRRRARREPRPRPPRYAGGSTVATRTPSPAASAATSAAVLAGGRRASSSSTRITSASARAPRGLESLTSFGFSPGGHGGWSSSSTGACGWRARASPAAACPSGSSSSSSQRSSDPRGERSARFAASDSASVGSPPQNRLQHHDPTRLPAWAIRAGSGPAPQHAPGAREPQRVERAPRERGHEWPARCSRGEPRPLPRDEAVQPLTQAHRGRSEGGEGARDDVEGLREREHVHAESCHGRLAAQAQPAATAARCRQRGRPRDAVRHAPVWVRRGRAGAMSRPGSPPGRTGSALVRL